MGNCRGGREPNTYRNGQMGKSSEALKNERLVPSAFALRMAGKQQGSVAGEAGAPTALIPLLGISEEKKKKEKNHPATSLKLET